MGILAAFADLVLSNVLKIIESSALSQQRWARAVQVEEIGAFLRALGLADGEDAKQGEDVPFITIRSAHASISFLVVRPCAVLVSRSACVLNTPTHLRLVRKGCALRASCDHRNCSDDPRVF